MAFKCIYCRRGESEIALSDRFNELHDEEDYQNVCRDCLSTDAEGVRIGVKIAQASRLRLERQFWLRTAP